VHWGPDCWKASTVSVYAHELRIRGLNVIAEKRLPIRYGEIWLPTGLRLDLLVEERVIVEVKAVRKMTPVYQSQILSHLKLAEVRIGLLINFNVRHLRHGIQRMIRS
jgi:GxxExxY protein